MSSTKLIEQLLSGQSARHIVDALIEELPPLPALKSSIQRELPRGVSFDIEGNAVFIHGDSELTESVLFLESAYPELDFILKPDTTKSE